MCRVVFDPVETAVRELLHLDQVGAPKRTSRQRGDGLVLDERGLLRVLHRILGVLDRIRATATGVGAAA